MFDVGLIVDGHVDCQRLHVSLSYKSSRRMPWELTEMVQV